MHIIISRDPNFRKDHKRVKIRPDLEECLREAATSEEEVFVIGGGVIYEAALPYAEKVYLTQIQRSFEADTYFPRLGAEWELSGKNLFSSCRGMKRPIASRLTNGGNQHEISRSDTVWIGRAGGR